MPNRTRTPLSLLCLALLLTACAPQPLAVTRTPATLRLVVADSCAPMADALAAAYEDMRPWVTVDLVGVYNSAEAEEALRAGEADVALLSWRNPAGDDNLWSAPYARDGIAVIVHPTTPITETGIAFLQEIFRGRLQEWQGIILVVVSREQGSGARAAFDSAVLGERRVTPTAVVVSSSEAMVAYVAGTPGAIGYVSTLRLDEGVRVLPVEGVLPTADAIADGRYPLSRPLYLATVGEPTGEAREFAQWTLGPKGQAVIRATLASTWP